MALADESCADLARRARSECDQGRDATDRDVREAHWQRGKALAERAIQLDDNDANAHFALFCNQGELMRIDGESIASVFEFRRLMKELDRALELDPNNLDALSSKGTLLVRLPRLMGGDTKRGEALLREVVDRDPKAFNARLALCREHRVPSRSRRTRFSRGRDARVPPTSHLLILLSLSAIICIICG